ncbi:MAG: CHASE3 domain-containing protein [Janthinobacterium lividum]
MRWLALPKMAFSLLLATLAAMALVGINEAGYTQSHRALSDVGEAQQKRLAITTLMQNVVDAETGQRGYLLTGTESYRAPYDDAVRKVYGQIISIRALYDSGAAERMTLDRLMQHVSRKLGEMDMSVRMRSSGNDAWRSVIDTDLGRSEMTEIRKNAATLIASSNRALLDGQTQIAMALRLGRIGILLVALTALAAFYLYLRQTQILQSIGARQQDALQRERNALESEVKDRTAMLAELATHLQEVRETERGYLARELHDELGSLLTAAKLDVARLKSRLAEAPDAIQRLQHLTELLNSGIALKRRIIEDLRPSSLSNLGLVASLEILGREFAERSGLRIEMALEAVDTDEGRQLTIYRMVQESLTNIGKYAEAAEATIVMKNHGDHVVVEVSDNGKGFEPQQIRTSTHGLAGMRHRVETAKGKLTVASTLGQGTKLTAMIPIRA